MSRGLNTWLIIGGANEMVLHFKFLSREKDLVHVKTRQKHGGLHQAKNNKPAVALTICFCLRTGTTEINMTPRIPHCSPLLCIGDWP